MTTSSEAGGVEAEFESLESTAECVYPGLNELLQAYGGHESAVRSADAYLSILSPLAQFTTTDSSEY